MMQLQPPAILVSAALCAVLLSTSAEAGPDDRERLVRERTQPSAPLLDPRRHGDPQRDAGAIEVGGSTVVPSSADENFEAPPGSASIDSMRPLVFSDQFGSHALPGRSAIGQTDDAGSGADVETHDALAAFRGTRERREMAAVWKPAVTEEEIDARIAVHTPSPITDDGQSWLPASVRSQSLAAWASVRESLADWDGARDDYARSIALGGSSLEAWRGLARTRVRSGELEAAEAAFLSAERLARIGGDQNTLIQGDIVRELGELYLKLGFPRDAADALDRALDLAPGSSRAQALWTLALSQAEGVAGSDSIAERIELWPPTRAELWRDGAESTLDGLFAHAPDGLRGRLTGNAGVQTAVVLGTIGFLLLCVWVGLRLGRKTGDLVVGISVPDELKGHFSVRLATQPGRHRRLGAQESKSVAHLKSTRFCHYSVSRETHFLRLPARRYWVTVQGTLSDPNGDHVLGEPYEELSIEVAGNETNRIDFDLSPRDCPVDVTVRWDKRGAGEVGVVARGHPQSLRYQANGKVRLRLPMGSHTIVVGSGDRVAERDVEVQSHKPTRVEIDLAGSEHLVFKGCPPAVESYLHGDLNGAARALERDGHQNLAHLLLARLHQEQGQTKRAAEQLESAGHHLEAAKMYESLSDFEKAATLFESAGNPRQAAESWRTAGNLVKAGELFLSIGLHAKAMQCFQDAGATDSLIGAMEVTGQYFDAARIAIEDGDRARGIRLLQQVGRSDVNHPEACMQLVEAYEKEGHLDLAARKLEDYLAVVGTAASPDLHSHLAELLSRSDESARALGVLEGLRRREPTYPNIASRIEALRKIVSSGRRIDEGGSSGSTITSFASDRRYEVLEEIGRGGMGLIFRARDRRLNRIVALKRLPENLREHPKALQLFLNEAQAAARLNHPNIVTVYDTDEEDGAFFITMELLQGMPLNTVLRQRGRLGPRDTARIGAQVARGLQYAHDQQVVHRDIKTANLFLTQDKVVKIMDFGLAKMIEEVRRGSTVIGGTPSYMSPEQAVGERVDHRADLYSLGVTLFELVIGRVPFDKGDVAYHHRHTAAPDPRSIASGIPDALADLILQLMQKDPEARCASAGEVEHRLDRIVQG